MNLLFLRDCFLQCQGFESVMQLIAATATAALHFAQRDMFVQCAALGGIHEGIEGLELPGWNVAAVAIFALTYITLSAVP
jgi:hypothetical protein